LTKDFTGSCFFHMRCSSLKHSKTLSLNYLAISFSNQEYRKDA
jgi:hypothetical protein